MSSLLWSTDFAGFSKQIISTSLSCAVSAVDTAFRCNISDSLSGVAMACGCSSSLSWESEFFNGLLISTTLHTSFSWAADVDTISFFSMVTPTSSKFNSLVDRLPSFFVTLLPSIVAFSELSSAVGSIASVSLLAVFSWEFKLLFGLSTISFGTAASSLGCSTACSSLTLSLSSFWLTTLTGVWKSFDTHMRVFRGRGSLICTSWHSSLIGSSDTWSPFFMISADISTSLGIDGFGCSIDLLLSEHLTWSSPFWLWTLLISLSFGIIISVSWVLSAGWSTHGSNFCRLDFGSKTSESELSRHLFSSPSSLSPVRSITLFELSIACIFGFANTFSSSSFVTLLLKILLLWLPVELFSVASHSGLIKGHPSSEISNGSCVFKRSIGYRGSGAGFGITFGFTFTSSANPVTISPATGGFLGSFVNKCSGLKNGHRSSWPSSASFCHTGLVLWIDLATGLLIGRDTWSLKSMVSIVCFWWLSVVISSKFILLAALLIVFAGLSSGNAECDFWEDDPTFVLSNLRELSISYFSLDLLGTSLSAWWIFGTGSVPLLPTKGFEVSIRLSTRSVSLSLSDLQLVALFFAFTFLGEICMAWTFDLSLIFPSAHLT